MITLRTTMALTVAAFGWVVPAAATAQQPAPTSTWVAWVGCWDGAGTVADDPSQSDAFVVCFQTGDDRTTAEILTYVDGALVALEELVADGTSRAVEEDGCAGERHAAWSADGSRVFLGSTMTCAEGVERVSRGVMALLPGGNGWSEIQSVDVGGDQPLVGIRTFTSSDTQALSDAGIPDPAVGIGLAVRTARGQRSRSLDPADLVESVENAGAGVTSALLVERGDRYGLDRETISALQDRGVPGSVVDVLVAMSYPERFQVSGGANPEPGVRPVDEFAASERTWPPRRTTSLGYYPWGPGFNFYWDPFWSYRYGYGSYGYGGYGYGPYWGYGGYRYPRVIVIGEPTVVERSTLSRERGVVTGGGSPDARPSRNGSSGSRPDRSSLSGSSGSTRSSPEPSRASPSSGSSSGGDASDTRRARPRD